MELNRGRIETRELVVMSAPAGSIRWPGLMQIGKITRTRTVKNTGKTSVETVYFITSLPESQTSAEQLLGLLRRHWHIENSLHWVKDNIFAEDRSTIRTEDAPKVASALRNLALYLLKKAGYTPTIGREFFSQNISEAIKLVTYGNI